MNDGSSIARERHPPGRHFIEHRTERKQTRTRIQLFAACLLRLVSNSSDVAVGIAERLIPSATVVSFARPKSRIFARPRFVIKMFAGLMSRSEERRVGKECR